ncbi:DUF1488 family protein [Photorhabdus stackebrandtii]|uniref:DUF1488 family protein n=1 Tax=Photorhabdus stackebrandtii TaxID=1123042 RepID=UPI0030EC7FEE
MGCISYVHETSTAPRDLLYRYGEDHHPLNLFRQNRWDLEEEFESLINNGDDDHLGRYILPSCR